MIQATFNTLKFAKRLQIAGFSENQAVALTEAQNEAFMETTERVLATKNDIIDLRYELKTEIAELRQEVKAEIAELRQQFKTLATKSELAELRQEMHIEIAHIKAHLKLHNWMISFVLTGIVTLLIKSFFG